jgi:hemerythrin superfamily protein
MATKRKSTRTTTRRKTPAAIALLKADHREVKDLFKQFEAVSSRKGREAKMEELARQICLALTVHAQIEEEIFYPAAKEAVADGDLLDEAQVEHASAKQLIGQIQRMSASDELFKAKVTVLGEYVNHHVKEEENEIFPAIKPRKIDLDAVGEEMAARKEKLMQRQGQLE